MLERATNAPDSPQTEEVSLPDQLLHLAQAQGYLLYDDLLADMPEVEENMAQLEELFVELSKQGLAIYATFEEAEENHRQVEAPDGNGHNPAEINKGVDFGDLPPDDTLTLYLQEMMRTPLLTANQEIALAKQYEQGCQAQKELEEISADAEAVSRLKVLVKQGEQARRHLIKANARLVVSVAKKYVGHGVPFVDLIQEGNLGLMRATDKFDYRRGYKFSTYATWWIRQAVSRALASQGRTIRVPVHMDERFRKLRKISGRLEQALGRQPAPEELAREMALSPTEVRWMLKASQHAVSLEQPISDEGEAHVGDFIKDEDAPPPPEATDHHLLQQELEAAISTLTPVAASKA